MTHSDLTPDEFLFLKEALDFEQSLPMLVTFVHNQHPELGLAQKFESAQTLVERLCAAGLLQAVVVKYAERRPGFFEATGSQSIPIEELKQVWSNPYLWGAHSEQSGGAFFGIEHAGRTCLALEPTHEGAELAGQK